MLMRMVGVDTSMSISISCPQGHPVVIPAARLGSAGICPSCCESFLAEFDPGNMYNARPEKGKSRRSRDDDDDDDDEDDEDEEEEEEPPRRKKKPVRSRREEEEDDDDDDDEDEVEELEEEAEIDWTPRKRQLSMVNT